MNIDIKAIVRIFSDSIIFDWGKPFNNAENTQSVGTGFFIDDQYILTCYHVVDDATKIYISIPSLGKEKHEVVLASCFPELDIALLKTVDYKTNSFLELCDSDKVIPTEIVFAIGYPLGIESVKYSNGIISGIQDYLFQIDAPINPGNSGGPLINSNNKVIAINSSKITSIDADNIGFSIPINFYKNLKDIMKSNKIIRMCDLLIEYNELDDNLWNYCTGNVKNIGISGYSTGVYIKKSYTESGLPINTGDILLEINGYKIDNYGEMIVEWTKEKISIDNYLVRLPKGSSLKLVYWSSKDKQVKNINHALTYEYPIKRGVPFIEPVSYFVLGGLVIMNMYINHIYIYKHKYNSIIGNNIKKFKKDNKILISSILSGSEIIKNDVFNEGDIIVSINDIKIQHLDDIVKIIDETYEKYNGYIIIKNYKNDIVCLHLAKSLLETLKLASKYGYKWDNPLTRIILKKLDITY
jgi:serine protease Do